MCYEVNGDIWIQRSPIIFLNVYVVDPDASEVIKVPDCGEGCIILEYYEDETFDVILDIDSPVTYQFQNLDYDDCEESYISYNGPV